MQHMMNRFRPFDSRDYATPNDGWSGFGARAPRTHRSTWNPLRRRADLSAHTAIDHDALGGLADVDRLHARTS